MKAIINYVFIGILALAVPAWGAHDRGEAKGNAKVKVARGGSSQSVAVKAQGRSFNRSSHVSARNFSAVRSQPKFTTKHSANFRAARSDNNVRVARENNFRSSNKLQARRDFAAARQNFKANQSSSVNVARPSTRFDQARTFRGDRSLAFNRARNAAIVNTWRSSEFSSPRYSAFYNYNRTWHDRYWYHSNFPRITFYFGAPYYWNSGYWYPAWGYYPDYTYSYDGPIYGYNGLDPDRVVMDVQVQLQREGYYAGPIDGVIGPMTRGAISAYQADHGLAITSAIDQPTLSTLGLS